MEALIVKNPQLQYLDGEQEVGLIKLLPDLLEQIVKLKGDRNFVTFEEISSDPYVILKIEEISLSVLLMKLKAELMIWYRPIGKLLNGIHDEERIYVKESQNLQSKQSGIKHRHGYSELEKLIISDFQRDSHKSSDSQIEEYVLARQRLRKVSLDNNNNSSKTPQTSLSTSNLSLQNNINLKSMNMNSATDQNKREHVIDNNKAHENNSSPEKIYDFLESFSHDEEDEVYTSESIDSEEVDTSFSESIATVGSQAAKVNYDTSTDDEFEQHILLSQQFHELVKKLEVEDAIKRNQENQKESLDSKQEESKKTHSQKFQEIWMDYILICDRYLAREGEFLPISKGSLLSLDPSSGYRFLPDPTISLKESIKFGENVPEIDVENSELEYDKGFMIQKDEIGGMWIRVDPGCLFPSSKIISSTQIISISATSDNENSPDTADAAVSERKQRKGISFLRRQKRSS
jgi:hypothetical protein